MERPDREGDRLAALDGAPEATRWAAGGGRYGQLLRGDPYMALAMAERRADARPRGRAATSLAPRRVRPARPRATTATSVNN